MNNHDDEWIDALAACLRCTDSVVFAGRARGYTRERVLGTVEGVLITATAFPGTATHTAVMTHFNSIWPEEN